jgi:hypothetical protein
MFDTIHNNTSITEYVPYCKEVNVTEKRAPTDESVRLLNEFQEKAKTNIIENIIINENIMKGAVLVYFESPSSPSITIHGKFELNAKTYIFKDDINMFQLSMDLNKFQSYVKSREYVQKVTEIMVSKFSNAIAKELLLQSPDFMKNFLNTI